MTKKEFVVQFCIHNGIATERYEPCYSVVFNAEYIAKELEKNGYLDKEESVRTTSGETINKQ